MDGYDAAEKIVSHFNNENRLLQNIDIPFDQEESVSDENIRSTVNKYKNA